MLSILWDSYVTAKQNAIIRKAKGQYSESAKWALIARERLHIYLSAKRKGV